MMRTYFLAASLVLLSGCQPVLQQLSGSKPAKAASLSSAVLTGPVMQIDIPSRGANAPLSRVAVNGDVETWLAVDNISVSFRQGVLVASRGLGFDLMGADAQGTLDALVGYDGDIYRRQMRYLTGDQHSTYLMAGCIMVAIGPETVEGQRLQRFEESCKARQHEFTNIFWLEGNGAVIRSRQWLSPEIGYLITNLIK